MDAEDRACGDVGGVLYKFGENGDWKRCIPISLACLLRLPRLMLRPVSNIPHVMELVKRENFKSIWFNINYSRATT